MGWGVAIVGQGYAPRARVGSIRRLVRFGVASRPVTEAVPAPGRTTATARTWPRCPARSGTRSSHRKALNLHRDAPPQGRRAHGSGGPPAGWPRRNAASENGTPGRRTHAGKGHHPRLRAHIVPARGPYSRPHWRPRQPRRSANVERGLTTATSRTGALRHRWRTGGRSEPRRLPSWLPRENPQVGAACQKLDPARL